MPNKSRVKKHLSHGLTVAEQVAWYGRRTPLERLRWLDETFYALYRRAPKTLKQRWKLTQRSQYT